MMVWVEMKKWGIVVVALLFTHVAAQECDPMTGICDQDEKCSQWKDQGKCSLLRRSWERCPVSCKDEISATTSNTKTKSDCMDQHERCHIWARLGECRNNRQDMEKYCSKSCGCGTGIVQDDDCRDKNNRCEGWAESGECSNNPEYMREKCPKSCNMCPQASDDDDDEDDMVEKMVGDSNDPLEALLDRTLEFGQRQVADGLDRPATLKRIQQTIDYLESHKVALQSSKIRRNCKNRNEMCSFWAASGECQASASYMNANCPAACFSCKLTSEECTNPPDSIPSIIPGDINLLFQRIVNTAPRNCTSVAGEEDVCISELHPDMPQFSVHVHSRPSDEPLVDISSHQDNILSPWLISLDDFLTQDECEAMIQLGIHRGYKPASQQEIAPDMVVCSGSCRNEELPKRIHERISRLLEIPAQNSEDFEFLQIEKVQSQSIRHDYDPQQKHLLCGPRIITMVLYLSSESGGIQFPKLKGLTINAQRGRVVFWPNVLDSNPSAKNARMEYRHTLLADDDAHLVAYARIHLLDWLTPFQKGCV